MFLPRLFLSRFLPVSAGDAVFFRRGVLPHPNTGRPVFGGYFPRATRLRVAPGEYATISVPAACGTVTYRLSKGLTVSAFRDALSPCAWLLMDGGRVSLSARATAAVSFASLDGADVYTANRSGHATFVVRDYLFLQFPFPSRATPPSPSPRSTGARRCRRCARRSSGAMRRSSSRPAA
jgi:hypothetical protein